MCFTHEALHDVLVVGVAAAAALARLPNWNCVTIAMMRGAFIVVGAALLCLGRRKNALMKKICHRGTSRFGGPPDWFRVATEIKDVLGSSVSVSFGMCALTARSPVETMMPRQRGKIWILSRLLGFELSGH